MSRKKNKAIVKEKPKKEERKPSFFDNIVLKEKKEDSKPKQQVKAKSQTSNKKPGEIVQGYNPSMSFADILYSYETTGNPYSMPKPKASKTVKKESFGDILDQWEGKGKGKSKAQKRVESVKNTYVPTKSFGDILSSFEQSSQPKKKEEKIERKEKESRPINEFFKEEDEDNKVQASVAWSILGGKNESFVRPEVEKEEEKKEEAIKKEFKRSTPRYTPTSDFSDILDQFEGKVEPKAVVEESVVITELQKQLNEEKSEEETPISENGFFRAEDEDNKVSENVSWSILGGKNEAFVRPEVEVEETSDSAKPNSFSSFQKSDKSFSEILESFEKKHEKEKKEVEVAKTFEEILAEKGDTQAAKPVVYTLTKLRTMLPQATLDLHGNTQTEAEKIVKDFLDEAVESGLRKICIITGKGLHSESGEGVLRAITERVLNESGVVSEKNNAPLNAGGSGALWVILKA